MAKTEITTIWNKNFICVMAANTLMTFGHFTVNPLVASYAKYLGTSDRMTGFLAGMFFGVALAIRPISGPLITKLDKRILLMLTFLCGCIASLGYAMSGSVAVFAIFRFLNGLEYSFLGTLVMTLASDNLPLDKMASGMGLYTLGSAIGTAVAPIIGEAFLALGTGVKDEGFGFTLVFLFSAAALALAIVPAALLSPDKKSKEDIASTGAWYKNILTVHALPITVVVMLVQAVYSLFSTYMIEFGKEQSIAGVSIFFTVLAAMLAVSRPMSGVLTDRFGVQKIIYPGLVLFTLSFLVVGSSTVLWMVLVGGVLAALGYGSSYPPLVAMCMKTVQPLKRGVASNTIYMGLDLGLFLGPLLGGFVKERYNYASMYKMGMAPVILALVGFTLLLPMYKRRLSALDTN